MPALAVAPGVRDLTPDAPVALQGKSWLPDTGETPMSAVNQVIGTPDVWLRTDPTKRTVTGKGIGVALIDSGVTPVAGLGREGGRPHARRRCRPAMNSSINT